ncbi:MAG: hypothetical protein IJ708_15185, partial [Clostridia bacterium]|nr:hypothetical protein [Clostridia bacterium]
MSRTNGWRGSPQTGAGISPSIKQKQLKRLSYRDTCCHPKRGQTYPERKAASQERSGRDSFARDLKLGEG